MQRVFAIILSIGILIAFGNVSFVQAETLAGLVVNQHNRPIPGLTVSLVHPSAGRSFPTVTDSLGRYYFSNVPRISAPFYIEVYWGNKLLYRNTVAIVGNAQLPPIILVQ